MEGDNEQYDSGDYSRFGIPDAPRTTVATPIGKTRTYASLTWKEKVFLFLSFLNILTAVGLTLYRLIIVAQDSPNDPDFTFTLLIIVNAAFVAFYVLHGVLRERKYELYVQTLAVLIILVYCIVEYSVNTKRHSDVKLARLITAIVLAPPNIILAVLVARDFGELEFRIAGASGHLQKIYNEAAIFSCWLKFDLQVTVSLVIMVLQKGVTISTLEIVTISVGVPYTLAWVIFGWLVLRLELAKCAFLFAILGLAKPAYYIFKFVKIYKDLSEDDYTVSTLTYCILIAGALGILVWLILMIELVRVYKNFGQGLKEKGKIDFGSLAAPGHQATTPE